MIDYRRKKPTKFRHFPYKLALNINWLNCLAFWSLDVPGEGCSRNVSCALGFISTFLLLLNPFP